MSEQPEPSQSSQYRVRPGGSWSRAWQIALALSVVGWVGVFFGYGGEPERFGFSYLFAFTTTLTLALGALFFVVLQHLGVAGWSVGVRRSAEFFMAAAPVLLLLFVPLFMARHSVYPWMHEHGEHGEHAKAEGESIKPSELVGVGVAQAQAHGDDDQGHGAGAQAGADTEHAAEAHSPMEEALHHRLMQHKVPYLNDSFFTARAWGYLLLWSLLALAYFRWSTSQDKSGDPALTRRMEAWAPVTLILASLSLTFAAFDWVMSLEPAWYSTIFGVYVFAGAIMSAHALLIVITLGLRSEPGFGAAVNVEHYHDLGKLLFGFTCFWAYIGFSQWMLIWYAGIPEEAGFFHVRWQDSGWRKVTMALIFGHFALPFLFLMSRIMKRRLGLLLFGAVWLLVMHVLDVYWLVMPTAADGLHFSVLDLSCLLAVVGLYLAAVLWLMRSYPIVPLRDPRLARALSFHNA